MNYAPETPTNPGYYWLKSGGTEEIVEVWADSDDIERQLWIHRCGDGDCSGILNVKDALWAGPISRPL